MQHRESASHKREHSLERLRYRHHSGLNLLDSAWHHVAGAYDGSSLFLYVDGRLAAKAAAKGFLDYRFWPGFVLGRIARFGVTALREGSLGLVAVGLHGLLRGAADYLSPDAP